MFDTLKAWFYVLTYILQVKLYGYDQSFWDDIWCMHKSIVADSFEYVPRKDMIPTTIKIFHNLIFVDFLITSTNLADAQASVNRVCAVDVG